MRHLFVDGIYSQNWERNRSLLCEHDEAHQMCPSGVAIWPWFYQDIKKWNLDAEPYETGAVEPAWPYPPCISNIETIHLGQCSVSDTTIEKLLSACKNLKCFYYEQMGSYPDDNVPDHIHMARSLTTLFSESLEQLTLSYGDSPWDVNDNRFRIVSWNSLAGFRKLKKVSLDIRLCRRDHKSHKRLSECLPPGIEVLNLQEYQMNKDLSPLKDLFRDFLGDWREKFPNLKEIQVSTRHDSWADFVETIGMLTDLRTQTWVFNRHRMYRIVQT